MDELTNKNTEIMTFLSSCCMCVSLSMTLCGKSEAATFKGL